jgi:hypothetical protein
MSEHDFLIERGAEWLNKVASNIHYRCQFVVKEFGCMGADEIPDIFGLNPTRNVLIEVKTSRADFFKDFKKRKRIRYPIGHYRFYLVPDGLVEIKEIPENWGLLVWSDKIELRKDAVRFNIERPVEEFIYYSVLRRVMHYQIFDFRKKHGRVARHKKV